MSTLKARGTTPSSGMRHDTNVSNVPVDRLDTNALALLNLRISRKLAASLKSPQVGRPELAADTR